MPPTDLQQAKGGAFQFFFSFVSSFARSQRSAMGTFDAEVFVLLAIGLVVISLRTYARLISVGLRRLQTDDYLMLLAAVSMLAPLF